MEKNENGKGYGEGTSKKGSVFPKKDKKSVKAMAAEKVVKAVVSSFKNDKKKINTSDPNSEWELDKIRSLVLISTYLVVWFNSQVKQTRELQREQIGSSPQVVVQVNPTDVKAAALFLQAFIRMSLKSKVARQSAKEIWEALQTAHEGIAQEMHIRFPSIINELHSLGEKLTIDELIENLKTYEMKKKNDLERREPKNEKNLVLKADNNDSSSDETDMAYLTRRFQNMVRKHGGIPKRGSSNRNTKGNDCYGQEDQVPDRRLKRRDATDNIVKQALDAWGDSSSESEGEVDQGDTSMITVESGYRERDSIFALMTKFDDDEDNEKDEVNFLNIQRNLKNYSKKILMSLANILIDAYHSFINEKNVLTEKIREVEQERYELVVIIADLKEQVEEIARENTLLKNQMKKWINTPKEKEVASETQLKLESELKEVKISLIAELEKNRQLQKDLKRVKNNLDKSLKWTWSSDTITSMYKSNGENRQGIKFHKSKAPYNPHRKYVTVTDKWLCTHYGQTGHYKDSCKAKFQAQQKNKVFVEKKPTAMEPGSLNKKYMMPAWTKRILIHPLYHYEGPNWFGFLNLISDFMCMLK
ncbi:uncharacterized protein [Nicotiana tomentosiformis]|uniref:uncharacterized protein n=1 Tax=Nicotiana tomentosiformis TaxID=4098 RepID=UPI00388C9900